MPILSHYQPLRRRLFFYLGAAESPAAALRTHPIPALPDGTANRRPSSKAPPAAGAGFFLNIRGETAAARTRSTDPLRDHTRKTHKCRYQPPPRRRLFFYRRVAESPAAFAAPRSGSTSRSRPLRRHTRTGAQAVNHHQPPAPVVFDRPRRNRGRGEDAQQSDPLRDPREKHTSVVTSRRAGGVSPSSRRASTRRTCETHSRSRASALASSPAFASPAVERGTRQHSNAARISPNGRRLFESAPVNRFRWFLQHWTAGVVLLKAFAKPIPAQSRVRPSFQHRALVLAVGMVLARPRDLRSARHGLERRGVGRVVHRLHDPLVPGTSTETGRGPAAATTRVVRGDPGRAVGP